jgi:type 1 glutamine amidotransferase
MKRQLIKLFLAILPIFITISCKNENISKTLIVTGQGNHMWQASSEAIKQILEETGLFSTTVLLSPPEGGDMSGFMPEFSKYKLVVIDYEGDAWPEETSKTLMEFVNAGGGVVMFNAKSDPGGTVPASVTVSERHNFSIFFRPGDHPVTKGLPVRWQHLNDQITQGMEVAGDDTKVLATAYSDTSFAGSGKREPMMVARNYGEGRIFSTMIGTPDNDKNSAMHSTGFIVTLQRGAEWAATGAVTQEVPFDFPTMAGAVIRPDFKAVTLDEAFGNIGNYNIEKSTKFFTFLQAEIRKTAGDENKLLALEKEMVKVLVSKEASFDSKKLLLRELSWMGTEYSVTAIKKLSEVPELKDDVEYALERLNILN